MKTSEQFQTAIECNVTLLVIVVQNRTEGVHSIASNMVLDPPRKVSNLRVQRGDFRFSTSAK